MAQVVYTGPFDAVDVDAAGVTAEKGVPIDVPDVIAASLVEQSCWKAAPAPAAARPQKESKPN